MFEYLKKVIPQIYDFIAKLPAPRKAALAVTTLVVGGGLIGLFYWAGTKTYHPLMSNLNPEDSAAVIRILREKHIPFRVDPSGKNVEIPPEYVYDLRLELATMGLPLTSTAGYEIFDKQTLGTTSFVQRINQKRALEGELMRTIGTIRGVKRARVHLAVPKESTFIEDQKRTTASVVVDLEPGVVLAEKQIFGIGTLVAKAVEGMDIADVVIVDSNGKVLSKNNSDSMIAMTASQLDFQHKFEEELEKRIETILSPVVGEGHVVARVTADLDFSQVTETQTIYDADGSAVRSVEKKDDSMQGSRPGPYGAPGATTNAPGENPATDPNQRMIRSDTKQSREITNYEVPQTTRRLSKPVGSIKKISVAVIVDGKASKSTDKDGKVTTKVDLWPPEKLSEFEKIVAGSVGLDKKRGDSLEIKNMEFTREDFTEAEKILQDNERRAYLRAVIIYSMIGLIILLFFIFVVRPFIKWVTENTIDSVDTFLPQTIEELEKIQKGQQNLPGLEESVPDLPEQIDPEKVEGEMIKEKIITLVDGNPQKAALVLRDWLRDAGKKKDKDAGGKKAG